MALRTLFLLLAAAELVVFGVLCDTIGFWPTLLLLLGSSVAGGLLLRAQGVTVLSRIQRMMEQGQSPVLEIVDALWLAAAAVMLLVPGFITTVAALALLLPITRRLVGVWLIGRYRAYAGGPIYVHTEFQNSGTPPTPTPPPISGDRPTVIDVEFEDIPPEKR